MIQMQLKFFQWSNGGDVCMRFSYNLLVQSQYLVTSLKRNYCNLTITALQQGVRNNNYNKCTIQLKD